MRILHVETRHRRGGAERNLVHTARWESARGHDVHLAVGADSVVDSVPSGVAVHEIGSLVRSVSPVSDLRALRDLRRLIRTLEVDVVHTHQSKAGILGRLAARGSGAVVIHTIHMASFGPAYGAAASMAFAAAERFCANRTDVIVSVGDELRRAYLDAGVGRPDQYMVVRSPIDVDRFLALRSADAPARLAARAALALPPYGSVAAVVASLERRKRVDLIIREVAAVPPGRPGSGIVVAIAGDGVEMGALRRLAGASGVADRIRFLGHVDDVGALLAASDVLVHAATVEGVPQVVIQALAAGVPVVATEMVGIHEVPSATISIVPAEGSGLGAAVVASLGTAPSPVNPAALEAWRPEGVDMALAALHARIEDVLSTRRSRTVEAGRAP